MPWSIDLAADHGAYRIEPGEALAPLRTRKSGLGWDGTVEHLEAIGFGSVCQRLPGPELSYGGTTWSWLYGQVSGGWVFRVGPHATYRADFHDPIFERKGLHANFCQGPVEDARIQWTRIRESLDAFQEGED